GTVFGTLLRNSTCSTRPRQPIHGAPAPRDVAGMAPPLARTMAMLRDDADGVPAGVVAAAGDGWNVSVHAGGIAFVCALTSSRCDRIDPCTCACTVSMGGVPLNSACENWICDALACTSTTASAAPLFASSCQRACARSICVWPTRSALASSRPVVDTAGQRPAIVASPLSVPASAPSPPGDGP